MIVQVFCRGCKGERALRRLIWRRVCRGIVSVGLGFWGLRELQYSDLLWPIFTTVSLQGMRLKEGHRNHKGHLCLYIGYP